MFIKSCLIVSRKTVFLDDGKTITSVREMGCVIIYSESNTDVENYSRHAFAKSLLGERL